MLLNLAVDLYVTKCAATQACHDYYNFAYLNFQRFMCLLLVNYATDFNIMFKTGADLLEGQAVAVLCRGSNGHCPPPPRLMVCPPPSCIAPIFFAQVPLPMYNMANGVDGWKQLETTVEIMN